MTKKTFDQLAFYARAVWAIYCFLQQMRRSHIVESNIMATKQLETTPSDPERAIEEVHQASQTILQDDGIRLQMTLSHPSAFSISLCVFFTKGNS